MRVDRLCGAISHPLFTPDVGPIYRIPVFNPKPQAHVPPSVAKQLTTAPETRLSAFKGITGGLELILTTTIQPTSCQIVSRSEWPHPGAAQQSPGKDLLLHTLHAHNHISRGFPNIF
jgi:hypothetical protein